MACAHIYTYAHACVCACKCQHARVMYVHASARKRKCIRAHVHASAAVHQSYMAYTSHARSTHTQTCEHKHARTDMLAHLQAGRALHRCCQALTFGYLDRSSLAPKCSQACTRTWVSGWVGGVRACVRARACVCLCAHTHTYVELGRMEGSSFAPFLVSSKYIKKQ